MVHRQSVKKTEMAERVQFVSMWLSGLSLRFIADLSGVSATTVRRWVRRWQKDGDLYAKTHKRGINSLLQTYTTAASEDIRSIALQSAIHTYFLQLIMDAYSSKQRS